MRDERIWSCPAGQFQGITENGVIQIKAIRYASSGRFCPPVPYRYPEGVRKMEKDAPAPVQIRSDVESFLNGMRYEDMDQEESCQYLSVTLPEGTVPSDRLPVMVWIYGGAFRNGGCDSPIYDRTLLVREGKVIVVALNYRLSLLGFMKDREGNPANLGILDQIEGLKWVRENISSFGGDPENVTIFGQSAGAESVRCIMLSEDTEKLYRRAILMSDPIGTMSGREKMEQKMLRELNEMPPDAPLEQVRKVQKEITGHVKRKDLPAFMIFGPHYGVAPILPKKKHRKKLREVMKDHDIMIGSASREGASYVGNSRAVVGLDQFAPTGWIVETAIRELSHAIFNDPGEAFAKEAAGHGGNVYLYQYCWMDGQHFLGGSHMSDIPLLFGPGKVKKANIFMGKTPEEIAEEGRPMRQIWTGFARTGTVESDGVDGVLSIQKM